MPPLYTNVQAWIQFPTLARSHGEALQTAHLPTASRITSPYGYTPPDLCQKNVGAGSHGDGIDFSARCQHIYEGKGRGISGQGTSETQISTSLKASGNLAGVLFISFCHTPFHRRVTDLWDSCGLIM